MLIGKSGNGKEQVRDINHKETTKKNHKLEGKKVGKRIEK
jgi:hypothetical protein